MQEHKHKNQKNAQPTIDSIVELWTNITLAHARAKRLSKKEPIRINRNYEYATK